MSIVFLATNQKGIIMKKHGKIIGMAALAFTCQFAVAAPVAADTGKSLPGYATGKSHGLPANKITSAPGYRLVPIEDCAQAPIVDVLNFSVTYPCGFKLVKISSVAAKRFIQTASISTKSISSSEQYNGSTIHDNGDGTSTINHGGNMIETVKTIDADNLIMQYADSGMKISKAKPTNVAGTRF